MTRSSLLLSGLEAGGQPVEFGKYTLVRLIGQGGMATVYLAFKTMGAIKKAVALKVSNDFVGLDPKRREGILNEIRIAGRMRHSNIVSVMDAGEHGGVVYIELELIDGHDLHQFVEELARRGQQLPFSIIAQILRGILEALNYAHIDFMVDGVSQQVVHRDLTPSNVILSTSGEVKVIDFGIGKYFDEHTAGGYVKGKPRYMAPEHATGSSAPSVDIFAVGAILYELIEGRRFRDEFESCDLYMIATSGRVPALTRADTPQAFRVLYDALVAPVRRRVYSAAAAMAMLDLWEGRPAQASELRALVRVHTGGTHSGYTQGEFAIPAGLEAVVAMANARAEAAGAAPARPAPPRGRPEPTVDAPRERPVQQAAPGDWSVQQDAPRDWSVQQDAPRVAPATVTPAPARAAANIGERTAGERTAFEPQPGVPGSPDVPGRPAPKERTAVLAAPEFLRPGDDRSARFAMPEPAMREPAMREPAEPEPAMPEPEFQRGRAPDNTAFVITPGALQPWHVAATFGVVLVLLAVVAMLMWAGGGRDEPRAPGPGARALAAEATAPPFETPEPAAPRVAGPTLAQRVEAPAVEVAQAPPVAAEPVAGEPVAAEPVAAEPVAAEPVAAPPGPEPAAAAPARKATPKAPTPKVTVRIIPMLARGELKIGKHVHTVDANSYDLALPVGKHRVRWRSREDSTWVDRPALLLSVGHGYLLHVGNKGTKLTAKDTP